MSQLARADGSSANDVSFFLPELCTQRAVLSLVLVSELLALFLVLADYGIARFSWVAFAILSVTLLWIALSSAALLCALRPRLMEFSRPVAALLSFLVVVLVAALSAIAGQFFRQAVFAEGSSWMFDYWAVLDVVVMTAIIGGLVLRYLYVQEELKLIEEAELQHRIQALQSRIRPHFLFNSMNIIASLIAVDPDKAEQVVMDLSELFRASLNEAGSQVPLEKEVALCQRYVNIEQLRIGSDRLEVCWNLDESLLKAVNIPLLTLQPLLENAIYHGIQPLPDGGRVTVTLRQETAGDGGGNGGGNGDGQRVVLEVQNPVSGQGTEGEQKTGGNRMALENIRRRLKALYGEQGELQVQQEQGFFIARIRYPFTSSAN